MLALKFFTVLKYFLSFRIFEQLALALKTEFALKRLKPEGYLPPAWYAYVRYFKSKRNGERKNAGKADLLRLSCFLENSTS